MRLYSLIDMIIKKEKSEMRKKNNSKKYIDIKMSRDIKISDCKNTMKIIVKKWMIVLYYVIHKKKLKSTC